MSAALAVSNCMQVLIDCTDSSVARNGVRTFGYVFDIAFVTEAPATVSDVPKAAGTCPHASRHACELQRMPDASKKTKKESVRTA